MAKDRKKKKTLLSLDVQATVTTALQMTCNFTNAAMLSSQLKTAPLSLKTVFFDLQSLKKGICKLLDERKKLWKNCSCE